MEINSSEINKILIIKPRGIGDIILSTIVLDNLTQHFPNAKIDYLVESFAKEVLENIPLINKVLTFDKSEFILKTIFKIRKEKYDLILDLWSNPKTAQLTFFSGADYRAGFSYRGRKYAYNIFGTSERGNYHSAFHNLDLLKPLNVKLHSNKIHFNINSDSESFANNFFNENNLTNKLTIGIIPSGGWDSKRCPSDKWINICRELIQNLKCNILVLWGPGDEKDAQQIKSSINSECILAPSTSLSKMSGLISKCNLIIANDSGPMHISAALGVPTLGLFGPTDPQKHGPFSSNSDHSIVSNLHCIICNRLVCPYKKECFHQMDVKIIVDKSKQLHTNNVEAN